jgi:Uma2 family endonuclease
MVRVIRVSRKPTRVARGPYTFEDFCALVPDGQKADLIDGVIYMASPDNTDAADLFSWLYTIIHLYVRRKKLGKVYPLQVAFRLNDRNSPEPDIGFVLTRHLDRVRRGYVLGAPDLALEIVSPDSIERDYEKKRRQFEAAGVREYWIVDGMAKSVTLLRLNAKAKYREIQPRKQRLQSQVIDGFWIDPSWLWQTPRPDELEILEQILGGTS